MPEERLIELALVVVLGIGAKWLAWRLHLPSILLLLLFGFAVGPGLGWVDPDRIFGDTLPPLVALFVAIILFEGGLSLCFSELPAVWRPVRSLIVVGAAITWILAGVAAHLLFGFDLMIAALVGAIFTVTGPTVILPLLQHVRPRGSVGGILKWEGIVIDPVGAMLAVLVFQVMSQWHGDGGSGLAVSLIVVAKTVGYGGALGWLGAKVLLALMGRYWVPDFLQAPVTLMFVVAAFPAANALQKEAGLLAVTLMGVFLANQDRVNIRSIVHFKENLNVLLISGLFILLAAGLDRSALGAIDHRHHLFLALLILVVRPLSVLASTIRSGLTLRERAYLCCMAPRGIVAAAVASVFSYEVSHFDYPPEQVEAIVPLTFYVITGTVLFYGILARRAARWLGVSSPEQDGFLVLGAHPFARRIARALVDQGKRVLLVDSNYRNVSIARLEGLEATNDSILSESAHDDLPLEGIGTLLTLTPNDEVNTLACLRYSEIFGRSHVFQVAPAGRRDGGEEVAVGGRPLFGEGVGFEQLEEWFTEQGRVRATRITEQFDLARWREHHEGRGLPLFAITEAGAVRVCGTDSSVAPRPGETLISLVRAESGAPSEPPGERASAPDPAP
ncbi:MAG: cation:proton antiporter [Planctomycetota bacterium]